MGGRGLGDDGAEELRARSRAGRLAREVPAQRRAEGDGPGDVSETDGELVDDEVGSARSGWRVATAEEAWVDVEPELHAVDVRIDASGTSAQEAAVHLVPEDDDWSPGWT